MEREGWLLVFIVPYTWKYIWKELLYASFLTHNNLQYLSDWQYVQINNYISVFFSVNVDRIWHSLKYLLLMEYVTTAFFLS